MNLLRAFATAFACCSTLGAAGADAGAPAGAPASLKADAASAPAAALTAQQIVEKCIEVRGGIEAWSKIESIIYAGHLESTRSPVPSLSFKLEEKRPNKSRFEITEPSQRSMRVFDGFAGWKMRTGEDGHPDIQKFTPQEVQFAREAPGLEGPLIDLRAKGGMIELEGTDDIDGHPSYRIGIRMASGEHQAVWIDTQTYLETRYDRPVYGRGGAAAGMVSIHYRDYKVVDGLALPSVLEIGGGAGIKPDRMLIEKVALNPNIDDREFNGLGDPRGSPLVGAGKFPR